jgi:hypothetical protein
MLLLPQQIPLHQTGDNQEGENMMDMRIIMRNYSHSHSLNTGRNPVYGINKVRFHNKYETLEHFMAKALISMLIIRKEKGIITEAELRNGRVIDILQFNRKGEMVGYEINSGKPEKIEADGIDIVDIPLERMPEKSREGLKELEKWLVNYII